MDSVNFKIPNFNNIHFKNKKAKPKTTEIPLASNLNADTFQKTNTVSETQTTESNFSDKKIEEIYTQVFNEFIKDNPIATELNLQKPKLEFSIDCEAIASYSVFSNQISLNPNIKDEILAYSCYDKNEEITDCGASLSYFIQQNYCQLKLNSKKIEITKLNEEEKKLYIKSVFAHELRHWLQEHIIMSTQECEEGIKSNKDTAQEYIKTLENLLEILIAEKSDPQKTEEIQNKLNEANLKYSYILNYKPSKILTNDTVLKISKDPNSKLYWSTKEHFKKAKLNYDNSDKQNYDNNFLEIDACNYQAEYLIQNNNKSIRKNVFNTIAISSLLNGKIKLNKLMETGAVQPKEN